MSRPFRVLTIDGGGMKGVYACSYLKLMEEHFSSSLHDHFDLIAGTSTGGIIALGLAAGKTSGEVLKFYQEQGNVVFSRSYHPMQLIPRALMRGSAHDQSGLRRALQTVFSDEFGQLLKMRDSKTRLCIPAVRTTDCQPRVFKAVCAEDPSSADLNSDLETTLVDVALATSAAPLYLPLHRFFERAAENCYVDGGLWANNPAMVGYIESKNIVAKRPDTFSGVHVLSVGLPGFVNKPLPRAQPRWHLLVSDLLEQTMEAGKSSVDYQVKILTDMSPEDEYYRVTPCAIGPAQQKLLRLDNASQAAISELITLGKNDAERDKRGAIRDFFR